MSDKPRLSRQPLKGNLSWRFVGTATYVKCQWGMISILSKLRSPSELGFFFMRLRRQIGKYFIQNATRQRKVGSLGTSSMGKLLNIGINSIRRRNYTVVAAKVLARLKGAEARHREEDALQWYLQRAEPFQDYLRCLDPALWIETAAVCNEITRNAQEQLGRLDIKLGGGGHFPLLYFLTRLINPTAVVETGVAAGWSSQAVLLGLRRNGAGGRLHSSDFPYIRYREPERFIGVLVDQELKSMWTLHIEGDRAALPAIISNIGPLNLFHHDSDKTYSGRDFAMKSVESQLSDEAIVIFDDIEDNSHFFDLVVTKGWKSKVFEFQGKLVGLTGPFLNVENRRCKNTPTEWRPSHDAGCDFVVV
jgi:predicted O-methyltransferase YrrM